MAIQKYSQSQIDKVIELKKEATPHSKITELTGVPNHKIKQIAKDNDIKLTLEQKVKNVTDARYNVQKPNIATDADSYKDKINKRMALVKEEVLSLIKDSKITMVSFTAKTKHDDIIFNCHLHGDFKRDIYRLRVTQFCPRCPSVRGSQNYPKKENK